MHTDHLHGGPVKVRGGHPEHSVFGSTEPEVHRAREPVPMVERQVRVPWSHGIPTTNVLLVLPAVRGRLWFRVHPYGHQCRALCAARVEPPVLVNHDGRHPVREVHPNARARLQVSQQNFRQQWVPTLVLVHRSLLFSITLLFEVHPVLMYRLIKIFLD